MTSPMTILISQSPEGTLDQSGHLVCGAVYGLVQGLRVLSDGHWLVTFEAGFDHAAFVVRAALLAVLVAEVDFHTRDPMAEPDQGALYYMPEPRCSVSCPSMLWPVLI